MWAIQQLNLEGVRHCIKRLQIIERNFSINLEL